MKVHDTQSFIQKAKTIHQDKYNYEWVDYIKSSIKVILECSKHGKFLIRPNDHLGGNGCKQCGYETVSKSKSKVKDGNSFQDLYPNKCDEWSTKNKKSPASFNCGSYTKVWRKCRTCNYEWLISLNKWSIGRGCPACCVPVKVVTINNCLATNYPLISIEWDYSKNKDSPKDVSPGSEKKRWFICPKCDAAYKTSIYSRTKLKSGCPMCNYSHGEKRIEDYLKTNSIEYQGQFRDERCRLQNILSFDFAIIKKGVCCGLIEYNGEQHYTLRKKGYHSFQQNLTLIQKRDQIKLDFCKQNQIPFLIIHYKDFNNIEILLKEFLDEIRY